MSCPLHALTHVHARTHTHTHVNSDVPGDSKSMERGLHPLCNKRWTWARPDWPGGEPCSRLSRAQHEPARPGATERPGRDVCRTTPIPLQEPCPSCQAGLTVPAPVLCWHAPAPNPTQPLLRRGSHTQGCRCPSRARWGRSPPLTPRVQGLLRPGTWDLLFPPLGHGTCGPSCALKGCGQTGDPQACGLRLPALRGPALQQVLRCLLPPSPSSQACLASAVQPFTHRAAQGGRLRVGRHSACRPRNFRLPFPGQHIASVWGSCRC